jgi:hypothetical protein
MFYCKYVATAEALAPYIDLVSGISKMLAQSVVEFLQKWKAKSENLRPPQFEKGGLANL